jgi:rare lipoprotein A (peptidoglycan hydrolase)
MLKAVYYGLLSLGIFLVVNIDSSYSNTINNSHIEEENSNQQVASEILSTDNKAIAQIQENLETFTRRIRRSPQRPRYIIASWYRHGRITANGERYNPNGLTVAHKSLPFNTMIRFTNPENGISVIVRVNDRGPYIRGRDFDLSVRSAQLLGFYERGVARLDMEIIR